MAIATSDFASHAEQQIERVAKCIGRSPQKRLIFNAVYYHKAKARTARDIAVRTGLTYIQVIKAGSALTETVFDQVKIDGEIAYARRREYHAYKRQILRLAGNKKTTEGVPTTRKIAIAPHHQNIDQSVHFHGSVKTKILQTGQRR
jgi:hypothetical protein